jgi:hypothetical protein
MGELDRFRSGILQLRHNSSKSSPGHNAAAITAALLLFGRNQQPVSEA